MKHLRKSFLSVLLTIAMVLAFIPSQAQTQEAAAATSSTSALYYNNGHRDTVATELSDAAKAYYSNYAYDYSKIADGTVSVEAAALKTSLAGYMQATLENIVAYKSLPTYWAYSDAEDGQAGVVYFYTDDVSTNTSSLNREHVWPKSAASYYELNGGADLHHLRPAHDTVNSARSNYEMGEFDETTGAKTVYYNGKVAGYLKDNQFEPLENVKGDVARIFLYVYLCWGQPNLFEDVASAALPAFDSDDSKNDGTKRIESLETLLQWCYDDPVDTWEMEQNDIIELVQGNRNVFIDYPEYAWLIFGLEVPEGIASPASGNAVKGTYNPGDLSALYGQDNKVEIDETTAISLAEANAAAAGTLVTVTGQVIARFGLNDSMTSAIIADENGTGLQLYFNNATFPYQIGDVIAVNGTIAQYHGVTQITLGFASKLLTSAAEAAPVAEAVEVTVAELVANPDAYLNKNVVVKNVVLGKTDSTNHTTQISQTIDGVTSTMDLYYPASYPSGVEMTDTVDIYAVASKRDTEAQLRVGSSSDYVLVTKGEGYQADLTTEEGILEAAFLLESGKSLGQAVSLTGEITSIKTAYSSQYDNISVNIKVADKTILCYRLAGGSDLQVGDVITVTGDITNYNGTVEFVAKSTYVKVGGSTVEPTDTPAPTATTAPTDTPVPTVEPTAEPTAEPTTAATGYQLITSLDELGEGGQIVIAGSESKAMANSLSSGKVTSADLNTENPDATTIWTITKQADGTYTLYNEASGKYLYINGTKTASFKLGDTAAYAFTVTEKNGGFLFHSTDSGSRYITYYAAGPDFRSYAASSALPVYLYKLVENETPEVTPEPTSTPVPTATNTPAPTATSTPVPTATSTPLPTATSTPVPTATNTPVPTATSTPLPTATNTPVPTEAFVAPETEGKYQLISSVEELGEGGLVVFYGISGYFENTAYAMGNKLSSSRPLGVSVDITDGVIENPTANIVWIVTKLEDGTYTLRSAETGKYLNLAVDGTKPFKLADKAVAYNLLDAEDGNFKFQSTANTRILSIYQNDFRAYNAGAKEMGSLNLYKLTEEVEEPTPTPVVLPAETTVTCAWGNTSQIDVTITNNTESVIKNWKVDLSVNGTISAVYNANLLETTENGYIISCPDWDKNIAVGETKTFTIVVEAEDAVELGTVTLINEETTAAAGTYSVSESKSEWYGGYVTNVEIANTSENAIDSWTLEFDFADEITSIWNATILSHEGNHYVIECASWNSTICANGNVSFGFTGVPANGEYSDATFENIVLKSVQ